MEESLNINQQSVAKSTHAYENLGTIYVNNKEVAQVTMLSGTTKNGSTVTGRSKARITMPPSLKPRQAMKQIIHRAQRLSSDVAPLSPGVGFRATRHSYDDALLVISDILAEAEVHAETGNNRVARRLLSYAEQFAGRTGFEELEQLVRVYRPRLEAAFRVA